MPNGRTRSLLHRRHHHHPSSHGCATIGMRATFTGLQLASRRLATRATHSASSRIVFTFLHASGAMARTSRTQGAEPAIAANPAATAPISKQCANWFSSMCVASLSFTLLCFGLKKMRARLLFKVTKIYRQSRKVKRQRVPRTSITKEMRGTSNLRQLVDAGGRIKAEHWVRLRQFRPETVTA